MEIGYVTSECTYTKKCPVCGEEFKYYPKYHQWLIRKGTGHVAVCRYNCMRKVERVQAEKNAEKMRLADEREITRRSREWEARKKMTSEPILRNKPEAWYDAQIEISKSTIEEVTAEIDRLKKSGEWKKLTAEQRKVKNNRVNYHTKKLQRLREGFEIVKQQKGYDA
jgi:hypothetical protein